MRNLVGIRLIEATRQLIARYAHVNWALADQAMISGTNFLTGILLARYLGIEEFGRFTLAWIAVLFVNSIQFTLIISPMMSVGSKLSDDAAPAFLGAVVIQQIFFSSVMFLLLLAGVRLSGAVFPEWQVEGLAFPLAVAALAFQFQDFVRRYLFTRERASAAFANDAIRYLGQIVVLIWLFLTFRDAMDSAKVLWIIAIMAAVAAVSGAFNFRPIEINVATLRATSLRHWHFSKWLTASALMQWILGNLFTITAGAMLGASVVGALKATQNLMAVTHILFQGLENIVPVRAARYFHQRGKKALYDYLKRVTLLGIGATTVVASIAAIVPDFWLSLVYGNDYNDYGYLLQWWAAIYVLIFLSFPVRSALRALEITRPIFWSSMWAALFSILAAYPLIQQLELAGAMIGIAAANVLLVSHLWLSLRTRLGQ